MTTTQIDWDSADSPMPLHVNADLTGADSVTTKVLDLGDPEATEQTLTYHSGNPVAGDFTVSGPALAVPGVYKMWTEVRQGTTTATFPGPGSVTILNVTTGGATTPYDELDALLANLPGYAGITAAVKQAALAGARIPDSAGVWPGEDGYVDTFDTYFAAISLVGFLQAQPVVRSSSSEGTSVSVDPPNWSGLLAFYSSMSLICQATGSGILKKVLIPDGSHVVHTNMNVRGGYDDNVDTDLG